MGEKEGKGGVEMEWLETGGKGGDEVEGGGGWRMGGGAGGGAGGGGKGRGKGVRNEGKGAYWGLGKAHTINQPINLSIKRLINQSINHLID